VPLPCGETVERCRDGTVRERLRDCNKVLTQAFCRGVILDQLSISKPTVSLSVAFATVFATTCLLDCASISCFIESCEIRSICYPPSAANLILFCHTDNGTIAFANFLLLK